MTNTRTQSNLRQLKSRNQREGLYCGYSDKHLRLSPSKFFIRSGLETLRIRWNLYWAVEYYSVLDNKYYAERYKP